MLTRRLTAFVLAVLFAACMNTPSDARQHKKRHYHGTQIVGCEYNNDGKTICRGTYQVASVAPVRRKHAQHRSRPHRETAPDAIGNIVKSRSGIVIRVADSAREALQCVVNYVEAAGVKIKAMRGYGAGTVRGSLHPSGRAIDINQTARDVTRPHVPRSVANAAADNCGVISGARWGYADNGHWNLALHGRTQEPWPRIVRATQ